LARKRRLKSQATLARAEVERALCFKQPGLEISESLEVILAEGEYIVSDGPHVDGPIARYQIRIFFSKAYPHDEPIVMETAGAIEPIADRHMYLNGSCCTCVWEEWLATATDTSVQAFCDGPLQNFFLGQAIFDQVGDWPFGDREHGAAGVVQAAGAIIGLDVGQAGALRYLQALSAREVKGHWTCPCGSGLKLRDCCHCKIAGFREQVDRDLAVRLRQRLVRMIELERDGQQAEHRRSAAG
jgi:SEC-C motif